MFNYMYQLFGLSSHQVADNIISACVCDETNISIRRLNEDPPSSVTPSAGFLNRAERWRKGKLVSFVGAQTFFPVLGLET